MMNKLPSHLLDEIFFRLEPKSLAKLRCVDKSLQSYISDDLIFQSEYFSRLEPTLLHISINGSKFQPLILSTSGESPSSRVYLFPIHYYIIGSSSGLLLLYINGLCVVNPLTKKFKFLDHSSAKLFPIFLRRYREFEILRSVRKTRIGFVVDQIDRKTQRFKIVCVCNQLAPNRIDYIYRFEIYSEDAWRLSQEILICYASEFYQSSKPVYINGCLHWLRIDGSIIVFDVKSEKARLIAVEFPVKSKMVFCVAENRVNLVCATTEKICIYVLEMEKENIVIPRWNLVKEMENVKFDEKNLLDWSIEGFDGRFVVVREGRVIHGFENKWEVLGSIPKWGDKCREFYLFKPSWDSVVGLDQMLMIKNDDNDDDDDDDDDDDGSVTTLGKIIGLIRYRW